ncbi:MAG: HAMP domain-containing histidine kinase [Clostridia bacterium]|nr:HAMP domain-containing histidine kinase [Clostridia bacterium]
MNVSRDKRTRSNRLSLLVFFALLVFVILVLTLGLSALILWLLIHTGVISSYSDLSTSLMSVVLYMSLISLLIGTGLAFAISNIPLKPVNNIINKLDSLAAGDFDVRIKLKKPFSNVSMAVDIADSFNKMAEELSQTELLRSDFINNFSHEFKTPIVSIAGFAKLLKRGDLTPEQQRQYIDVIEEESLRLADMATNMMNLTRVENRQMLSDVHKYNLSEQIRSCVLLLAGKWESKRVEPDLDFDEYEIDACEELLKQAWINLIDNAVKFSPEGGKVSIRISRDAGKLTVTVSNGGRGIRPENLTKVFDRFYQEDESHAGKGNGIGLAIVQKVVKLHGGDVKARSDNGITTFTVTLPEDRQ